MDEWFAGLRGPGLAACVEQWRLLNGLVGLSGSLTWSQYLFLASVIFFPHNCHLLSGGRNGVLILFLVLTLLFCGTFK